MTTAEPPGPRGLAAASTPLTELHDVALLDLDGVVYRGPEPVPGAARHLEDATKRGMRFAYVTNNAARPPAEIADHLRQLGVDLRDDEVVTSAQAAARLVAGAVPGGAKVLVVGGPGLVEALAEHGLRACSSLDDDPAAVVQGFHRSVGWEQLAEGAYAVAAGLPWIASNLDGTIPTARGIAPGNGTLVAAVQAATGVSPVVAGKPAPALIRESVLRTGAERPLMVGDRLDTDISGATRYPMASLLVLTGVTSLDELLAAEGDERPDFVAADLAGLLSEHPAVAPTTATIPEPTTTAFSCAGWLASVDGGRLSLRAAPDAPATGGTPSPGLAALRAVVAAGWAARDGGAPPVPAGAVAGQLHDLGSR